MTFTENSSKPPSSDGVHKPTNLRSPKGKKAHLKVMSVIRCVSWIYPMKSSNILCSHASFELTTMSLEALTLQHLLGQLLEYVSQQFRIKLLVFASQLRGRNRDQTELPLQVLA